MAVGPGGTVTVHDGPDALDYPVQQYVANVDLSAPADVTCEPNATLLRVALVNVGGVRFHGCRFSNSNPSSYPLSIGYGTHDVSFDTTIAVATGAANVAVLAGNPKPTRITFTHVDFSGSSGDLIGAYNVGELTVTDSVLHDPMPASSTTDHVDGVQVVNPSRAMIARNRIYDSAFAAWGGPHQAIMVGGIGETANVTIDANTLGPWPGTSIITSDRSSTQAGAGYIHDYAITNNTTRCSGGGISAFWAAPSTPPYRAGNVLVPRDSKCPALVPA